MKKAFGAALVAGAVLAAVGAVTALAGSDKAGATTVKVSMGEMFFISKPAKVPAGEVTFKVKNVGGTEHEMILLKTKGTTKWPVVKFKAKYNRKLRIGEIKANKGKSGKATWSLKAGDYQLLCNIHGHYQLGMVAPFTVSPAE